MIQPGPLRSDVHSKSYDHLDRYDLCSNMSIISMTATTANKSPAISCTVRNFLHLANCSVCQLIHNLDLSRLTRHVKRGATSRGYLLPDTCNLRPLTRNSRQPGVIRASISDTGLARVWTPALLCLPKVS
jgi:hypothetical protein